MALAAMTGALVSLSAEFVDADEASAGLVVLSEAEANAGPTQVPTIFTLKCLSTDAIGLRSAIVPPESPANRSPTACGHPLMGFVTTSEPESPGWTKVATPPLPPLHSFVYKTSILTSSAKTVPVVRQVVRPCF